ncbi:MAG: hydantoinase B/oxoprolinase family protein [Proteobacteria bacterium]|nr:hydantoinase B/oxoprolinase family protein [Pseudomonadota bacterium]
MKNSKWKFAVDRGGTFTDVVGVDPEGNFHTEKLLSTSPEYSDASIEGIRRVLKLRDKVLLPADTIEEIRFGTTVATNALLERKGGKVALLTTKGFADLLEIGYQARPDIFDLAIKKPAHLYSEVIEVDERIDSGGTVIRPVETKDLEASLAGVKAKGIDTVAVVLMHAWKNPAHELMCEKILKNLGIKEVFLSHETMNLIKIVSRGQSTVVDAYLSPVIHQYLDGIKEFTGTIPIEFIQSSGGLSRPEHFRGKDAILSGPAGGVIGVAQVADELALKGVIGFDMGGTSTDVSRYDGEFEKVYEKIVEGIELQKEMLNINAVASGGGSILWFDGQKMRVGPESSGADPGPACYGFGGPLSVTDANLMTGRIDPDFFPKTFGFNRDALLNIGATLSRFEEMTGKINQAMGTDHKAEDVAAGFLRVANEKMALAIKEISVSRGYDVREYALVCFGGAGGQHACQVARLLDMKHVIFHPLGGLMSAYGIGLASPERRRVKTLLMDYDATVHESLATLYEKMINEFSQASSHRKISQTIKREVDLRPKGADSYITVEYNDYEKTMDAFRRRYERLFGFFPEETTIEIANIRVEMREESHLLPPYREMTTQAITLPEPTTYESIYFSDRPVETPLFQREQLPGGVRIDGPAVIVDRYSTLIVEPDFSGEVKNNGIIVLEKREGKKERIDLTSSAPDPVLLEVFNNLFMSVATEMGHTLKNTAHSVNIKERLDFSCAVFDKEGDLVANAPHIPVHLGAMADSVKAVIEDHVNDMQSGNIYMTNNPYRGGSHLPDITVVCPVFSKKGDILFFVAARGHHADIGGITPGSMPPRATHIDEEGILIDGMLIVEKGKFMAHEIKKILTQHRYPARNIEERLSDLQAKVAACHKGVEELTGLIDRYGRKTVFAYMGFIQQNAGFSIKKALNCFIDNGKEYISHFEDHLDDGTKIKVRIDIAGGKNPPETLKAVIDFTGTGPEHKNDNLNTPLSVTRSAVLYVLRTITKTDIPLNSGCLKPVEIIVPEGSILNPKYPSPVASGNVETSQRIVDVLLGALGVAAASQGTMNNLLFQVEGDTPYYETIAGGAGAMEGYDAASGVQVHMTNTRMTDPEILEFRHPDVKLEQFSLKKGSGGDGKYKGGDGVLRELKFLKPAEVSVISERRVYPPYGMAGGEPGEKGSNLLRKKDGTTEKLGHRFDLKLEAGEAIVVETPGGGGFGAKD